VPSGSAPLADDVDTVANSAAEVDVDSILDVLLNVRREGVLAEESTVCSSLRTTPRRTVNIRGLYRQETEGRGEESE